MRRRGSCQYLTTSSNLAHLPLFSSSAYQLFGATQLNFTSTCHSYSSTSTNFCLGATANHRLDTQPSSMAAMAQAVLRTRVLSSSRLGTFYS